MATGALTQGTLACGMARPKPIPVPLLVSLKAVDPSEYPYYGTAQLEPAMPLNQALQGDSAVVAEEFLIRVHRIRGLEYFATQWEEWENWFAELNETHTTFASLAFFRSPNPHRSWVTSAVKAQKAWTSAPRRTT